MKSETIIDIPLNYLIEFEIWDENNFFITIATDISLHYLIPEFNPMKRLH